MNILLIGNSDLVLYNFRKELIYTLIGDGHKVTLVCPFGTKIKKLLEHGCQFYNWDLNRHSINPFLELKSFITLSAIIKRVKPDYVLSYTIKPNLYSGFLSRSLQFKHIPNITGLGKVFSKNNIFKNFIVFLYRRSFSNSLVIFLQNQRDLELFKDLKIFSDKLFLLPGSGVNTSEFAFTDYPPETNGIKFLYLGRIMEQKGFDLFVEASRAIKLKHKNISFIVCGYPEKGYEKKLESAVKENIISYEGNLYDVKPILSQSHCLIQPSFYPEGISNVILEASSMGRPVITSTNFGCVDAVQDKITGLVFQKENLNDLINKIELFLNFTIKEKIDLSLNARKFIIKKWDRNKVIRSYLEFIK